MAGCGLPKVLSSSWVRHALLPIKNQWGLACKYQVLVLSEAAGIPGHQESSLKQSDGQSLEKAVGMQLRLGRPTSLYKLLKRWLVRLTAKYETALVDRNDLSCTLASTIIVTVSTTTTVTETVDLTTKSTYSSIAGPDAFSSATSSGLVPILTTSVGDITETTVIWKTFTSESSVVEISSPASTSPASGLYSFLVVSDITSWLGGATPPATDSFVTATATVVIEPVPITPSLSSTMQAQSRVPVTSIETIQVTSVFTADLAETLTESASIPPVSATASGFHGVGTYGWNATTLTRVTHAKHGSGTVDHPHATCASSGFAHHSIKPYYGSALNKSGWHTNDKRQVGAIITATIDGVIVSWTNSYDGGPPTDAPVPASYTIWSGTVSASVVTSSVVATSVGATSSMEDPPLGPSVLSSSGFAIWSADSQTTDSTTIEATFTTATFTETTLTAAFTTAAPLVTTSSSFFNTLPLFPSTHTRWTRSTIVTENSVPVYTVVPVATSSFTPLTITPFPNTTSTVGLTTTTTGLTASSSACNVPDQDIGNFTITFDDLPTFGGSPGDTDYPPIFNPYHHLVWSQGFAYAPPPSDPFPPISPPQLAVFVTNQSANVHPVNLTSPPGPGDDVDGEFGAGPNFGNSAFWINAYSAYLGCANAGPEDCEMTINGYALDAAFANNVLVARQTVYQPPCVGLVNCALMKVTFTQDFQNLTGLQVIASVGTNPLMYTWYMDNLEVGWADNSCEAGTIRAVDSGTG
ncbi:hypothetical protein MMC11_001944 [Xylographa trunciseda]|nr:hypothetical protein [Xylographa trunciseda]